MSKKDEEPKEKKKQPIPPMINFLLGGLSGMAATCVVHPMDVIKNRMQIQKGKASILNIIGTIYREEGIITFYNGLSAGLVRQATYTTVRLGTYNQMQDFWRQRYIDRPNFAVLAFMAASAGALGAFVGTPADVALVRMTIDSRLPVDQRRNYKNVLDAFMRIAKEEGIFTLWRGSVATVARAIVVNVSQLATYSQAKHLITSQMNVKEGIVLHFGASMVSGIITAFNSMPFDIAKTRIQNMKVEKPPGMISVMMSIAKNEGIKSLWKGFWPTYCRIGPHTVLTFIVNEQLMRLYRIYFQK